MRLLHRKREREKDEAHEKDHVDFEEELERQQQELFDLATRVLRLEHEAGIYRAPISMVVPTHKH